jgi:electron transfer flavoprotein beta subunit
VTVAILVRRALARPGQHDEEQILGPCERGALGLGLTLAEARGADAIAIAVGPARREDRVLAMALRAGCARALRVWDDGLEDLDYLGLAEVLAAAAKDVGATIVVCGDRSVDERVGALGPAVAEVLGVAHVSGVIAARVGGELVEIEHQAQAGAVHLRVAPPLVLATAAPPVRDPAAPAPRPPPGAQAIAAKDLAELGLDGRRLAPRRALIGRLRPLRGARQATILPDAAALIDRLRGERVLPPLEVTP